MLAAVFSYDHSNKEFDSQVLFTLSSGSKSSGKKTISWTDRNKWLEFKASFTHTTLGPKFRAHKRKELQKNNITIVSYVNNMSPQTVICVFF